ncbi:hypothetical protein J2S19_000826 [Metabacillus malikii]|uniref:Uncharacterized protein n=2 Tax=Metabacillus malikii TaxID=1504265 RepID=A0ABT9ZC34_9BACI|nr:hypothetical protein [Metabacillus malikii]
MYILFIVIILAIITFLYVDIETLKLYYPTIQAFLLFNFLYNFIFYKHTLWAYKPETPWLNHTLIEILYSFIIIPLVIIVFLRFFPTGWKGVIYLIIWVFAFWLIEYDYSKRGSFSYDNNWNIWWSLLFNFVMFPFFKFHVKRPFLSLICVLPVIVILLLLFHPSFTELK